MNGGVNVLRPGQPGQRDHRAGAATRRPQRRRRPARRRRPRHASASPASSRSASPRTRSGSPWEPLSVERGLRARRRAPSRSSPAKAPAASSTRCRATPESLARVDRRLPAHRAPPEAAARLRRHPRRVARARPRLRRRAAGSQAHAPERARRLACSSPARRSCAAPAASPRACPAALARPDAAEVPPRRPAASSTPAAAPGCSLRSSAAGPTAPPAANPSPRRSGHEGGHAMSRIVLDPTGERQVAERPLLPRPGSLDGRTIGLLDISKPRGNVFLDRLERAPRPARGVARAALHEADVHQAGAGRPPPRDRHAVRARDRGARRLRELHVVQCARHRRSREPGACPSSSSPRPSSSQAADAQATSLGFPTVARVFTPHPIQDRTDDEMRAYADAAYDEILAKLTT